MGTVADANPTHPTSPGGGAPLSTTARHDQATRVGTAPRRPTADDLRAPARRRGASAVVTLTAVPGRIRLLAPLDPAGSVAAMVFWCASLTPSLLPRSWVLQGVVGGVLAATGYLVGVCVAGLGRWAMAARVKGAPAAVESSVMRQWLTGGRPMRGRVAQWWLGRRVGAKVRTGLRWLVWTIGPVLVVVSLYQGAVWQRQVYRLMGVPAPTEFGYLGVPLLAAVVAAPFVATARILRVGVFLLRAILTRWAPPAVARVVAVVVVTSAVVALMQGLVANGMMVVANATFRSVNDQIAEDVPAPTDPALSGSSASLIPWSTLGKWGRYFVSGPPAVADLRAFSGAAIQPIRVYVGIRSAPTLSAEAALAVQELERTGAFGRKVLCVVTTTGTGWVDQRSVAPLEYMYQGDTATVALQYSYLPSVISFLADRDRVRVAGRELFNQVYAAWSRRPVSTRPKLVVFGESLGAFGAESAFGGLDDIRNRTDGALFVGPPNSSSLWGELVAGRDGGSSQVQPWYQGGSVIRFADTAAELAVGTLTWPRPRVVYLQHASDPVVWWSPRLVLHRPDWLTEPRGRDVLPAMRWFPFVTFWQLTADLTFSAEAPAGHGHNYRGEAVDAWAQILPPADWNVTRTGQLCALVQRSP